MQLSIFISGFFAASCALAAPTLLATSKPAAYAVVFLYEKKDFGGHYVKGVWSGSESEQKFPCRPVAKGPVYAHASSYKVISGDCNFYGGDNCTDFMFRAITRDDRKLRSEDNDRIRSIRCIAAQY